MKTLTGKDAKKCFRNLKAINHKTYRHSKRILAGIRDFMISPLDPAPGDNFPAGPLGII